MRSDPTSSAADGGDGLVRALGLWDSTLLVIGLVLGSAVFMITGGPQGLARLLPSPGWLIAGWIAGGAISFAGALVYAELGAMLPRAGGQYVFLREAYGDLAGFLYGWTLFAVIHTGTLAALAVGYAEYFGYFVPSLGTGRILMSLPGGAWSVSAGQLNAAFVIVLLSIINYFGVKEGSVFQGVITIVKIASFAGFMALGLLIGAGSADHFLPLFGAGAAAGGAAAGAAPAAGATFGGFILAMVAMLWAYEGWNNITFTAGEIRDPQRNLPRALILGMSAITLIYVGMNLVYIYAMPVGDMAATSRIGEAAAGRLFGPTGATLMSLAVLVSVFGCISATVISGPRVFYAMARDGLFFRGIARVHPRHRTPARAIVWQGVWSSLLCLSGTYNQLFTFVIFAAVLFYALAGASVIVLRRRHPEWARPYRTWGYPATPLLFVALCVLVLFDTVRSQPLESCVGLAILAAGLPAYFFWKRRRDRSAAGRLAGTALLVLAASAGFPAGVARAASDPPAAGAAQPPGKEAEPPEGPAGIHGFHRASLPRQRALETVLLALPDPERAAAHARFLSAEPHVAGTPGGERVVRYILERFREAGLEAETRSYPVYLGYVKEARLDLIEPERRALATPEEPIAEEERNAGMWGRLNWNAYAPSCDLTGEVVFAHHAREEDFAALDRLGIEVRGRIVLARNFRGYRGGKALLAERRGAAALVLYSDPADDGAPRGAVYPDGPWGPDGHIQRGAIAYDFNVPGDPLTPGWASRPGGRRIRPEQAASLPRIPAIPIAARDARVLMRRLAGPEAPEGWRGGLGVPYRIGPGPARVRLQIDASFETRPITNVIGVLRGTDEPEREVILSNHHDAWVYGAADPVSGTAAMLEVARAAGELARRGFRPRRTLVFGSWDAEEWTLTGSTEWGEENARDLRRNGVACLNVDAAASGPNFKASAVPTLRRLISGVLRDVPDPADGGSLYDALRRSRPDEGLLALYTGRTGSGLPEVAYWALGSGSDYTVFFNHLGIPSLDAEFEGPIGVYHSLYDSHAWMSRFGDPGFRYHATMARVWGMLAYRVANADLLPFEESPYPKDVRAYVTALEKEFPPLAGQPGTAKLRAALRDWEQAAADYDAAAARALSSDPPPGPKALAAANRALMRLERDLLDDRGVPGRPWFRHQIFAPLPTYAPDLLPGLSHPAGRGDGRAAGAAAAALAKRLKARAATLRRATAALAAGSAAPPTGAEPVPPSDPEPVPPSGPEPVPPGVRRPDPG